MKDGGWTFPFDRHGFCPGRAHAAAAARAHFATEPDSESFSLGVNDGLTFGESPETLALTTPVRWFRGRPDYSALVFTFMNRAAGKH